MILVDNVSKIYSSGKAEHQSLKDISFEIQDGTINCIFGKSGSGKTTLLRHIALLDRPTTGTVWINGKNTAELSEQERSNMRLHTLGFVFQDNALIPELTAIENVILPHLQIGRDIDKYTAEGLELLSRVDLVNRARYLPSELSGGEQQRVSIARALINKPTLVLADEPTANLDSRNSSTVMGILKSLTTDLGITVIFITHDLDDKEYADRVINIRDGRIVSMGTP